jgi:hypothetical protein
LPPGGEGGQRAPPEAGAAVTKTSDFVPADARDGSAFSNSTQFEIWASNRGCWTCTKDDDATEKWCPILSAALAGGIPQQWTCASEEDWLHGNYTCSDYEERRDDGPGDPDPEPEPPPVIEGQIDMFEVLADHIADEASRERVGAVTG